METEVIMKRQLNGFEVSQKSKSGFLSVTDLLKVGNTFRKEQGKPDFNFDQWLKTDSVSDLVHELEKRYGKVKVATKGRNAHTWVHPYLFLDLALALSPSFKIEVYGWIFDKLLDFRNESGDSYKMMCGALTSLVPAYKLQDTIISVANKIKEYVGIEEWNTATEDQLKLRNRIHEYVLVYSEVIKDVDLVVDTAIRVARQKEDYKKDRVMKSYLPPTGEKKVLKGLKRKNEIK